MEFTDIVKILLLFAVVGIAVYILGGNSNEPLNNAGSLSLMDDAKKTFDQDKVADIENIIDDVSSDSNISDESIRKKLTTRDSARGKMKMSSYSGGNRGGKSVDLDKFFEDGNPKQTSRNDFVGNDETGGNLASYVPGVKRKLTEEDKFNASELLPAEVHKEWFDDPQTTSIKNSHMLNVYRPIGVDTVLSTLKNPSHDVRGCPPNPRYVVSPWLQSSYEPDLNLTNGALCA